MQFSPSIILLILLVLWPLLAAAGCLFGSRLRTALIWGTALVLPVSALLLVLHAGPEGALPLPPEATHGVLLGAAVADFLLLAFFLLVALRRKSILTALFVVPQVALLALLESQPHSAPPTLFHADQLSLTLVCVVSVVGSLICLWAVPYMREHERHLNLKRSRQPGFFLVLLGFLGAMNGLALAADLRLFYLGFELTTLCSFLLIGHDRTPVAKNNALRALWMNSVGGLALIGAMVWLSMDGSGLHIPTLVATTGLSLIPLALLVLAGLAKAAQPPFTGWLLGAMVAPTPTSALLHSSTMVKAGVYLVLRFSPAFASTVIGPTTALIGGFGFLAGAVLAMGRSDGKEVLAYSTISNLGLMIACAGLGTPWALAAGTLLLLFHALAKGLLFLCVGSADQGRDGRQAEDLRGLVSGMPQTAPLLALGVGAMLLPPFGMLLGKWMAVEAASSNTLLLVLLGLGSGLTMAYWTRWVGLVLSAGESTGADKEIGSARMIPQYVLAGLTLAGTALGPWLYVLLSGPNTDQMVTGFQVGGFVYSPLLVALLFGLALGFRAHARRNTARRAGPYLAGLASTSIASFTNTLGQTMQAKTGLYAFERLFGEKRLLPWINGLALAGLTILLLLAQFGAFWLGGNA
ncbi:proton-conducting transporter membrane subunit [Pseudodesulfovibrio sediminis]|uniref:Oxidoreductase n=1 Tax=Pseudodesulfovibrio sediminis TaxID=2810563 RepID=A0ABN6EY28_9BACT|nr:proton-conducting transporter membrane subunit [Pseudodesulfovibrio sediminis]BCS89921.1 oxidoreductase [Pseudodesulfovibrio sediminis]